MAIVKRTQSTVIPIYGARIWCIFIAGFDCMSGFLCSLHSEFTLQFSFEGVLQRKTLQVGRFSSLSHRQCQPSLRSHQVSRPESGETIFLFRSSRVTRHIYRGFEEMAFNLGVHPLRGQKSFQSVMVGLILKHGYRSKENKKPTVNTHSKARQISRWYLTRDISGHFKSYRFA